MAKCRIRKDRPGRKRVFDSEGLVLKCKSQRVDLHADPPNIRHALRLEGYERE